MSLMVRFKATRETKEQECARQKSCFSWGKHKGKTFHEIYDNEPSYVIWSISRLSVNAGPGQRAWLEYIEERVTADEKAIEEDGKNSVKIPTENYDHSADQSVVLTHFESRLSFLEQTVQEMAQRAVNMESLLQQVFQVSSASNAPATIPISLDRLAEGKS